MAKGKRNGLLIGVAGFVGLLIVALLAAPQFIDVAAYKPEIVAQVKRATGRDVVIEGPIRLSLLPTPAVALDGVKFFNLPGSKNPDMVEVKSVVVKPVLLALLRGEVEPGEVTLVEPKIVLEINAEGKPNWEFTPSVAEAVPAAAKPASPKPLSLGRLTVQNGTLIFSDSRAGLSVSAGKANFSASVGSIDGPYALAGGAVVNDAPLRIDLAVGAKTAAGHAVDVALEAGGGKLAFKGTLSELGPAARLSGRASAASDNLVAFAETPDQDGRPAAAAPAAAAGRQVQLRRSRRALADRRGGPRLQADPGPGQRRGLVRVEPRARTLGRRQLQRQPARSRPLAGGAGIARQCGDPAGAGTATPAAGPAAAPAAPAPPAAAAGWLANLSAKLAFEVGEVIYNARPLRGVALQLEARGGAVAVPKFTATLPGDLVVQASSTLSGDPARPTASGAFSLVGPRLRETLAWLAVDVSAIPAGKLTRLAMNGRMGVDGRQRAGDRRHFELDDLKGTGGIVVAFAVPLSVTTARRAGHARSRLLPAGRPAKQPRPRLSPRSRRSSRCWARRSGSSSRSPASSTAARRSPASSSTSRATAAPCG